jgi:transposase
MPKPYSQDLRSRVIDAVEKGAMSPRAAARRYEISESIAIKWLERVEWVVRERLSGTGATGRPS